MPRLSGNIFANLLGATGTLVVTLACIPPTIHVLGMEAYGLIGFCTLLQTMLLALQFGSPAILQRELSIASRDAQQVASDIRPLVATLEVFSWASALLIAIALAVALPWLATTWLKTALEPQVLTPAMILLGSMIALQWPICLYHAGLAGLERADRANIVLFLATFLRYVGGLAVLWFWAPDLAHYAGWQVCSMALYAVFLRRTMIRLLPPGAPRFSLETLRQHRTYAAGVTGNAITGLVLSQLDRVVLINCLSLEDFGFYVLAATLTSVLPRLAAPVTAAASPRLARLMAESNSLALVDIYHKAAQVLAVLLLPATLVVVVFSREILWVWTGDGATAARAAPLVSILFVSALLSSLMNLPYVAQIAYRWTSLNLKMNVASLILCTPLQIVGAAYFGPLGVAIAALVNSVARFTLGSWLMHRRILRGELWKWWFCDLGRPLAAALLIVALTRSCVPLPAGRWELLACLAVLGSTTLAAATATTSLPTWLWRRARTTALIPLRRHHARAKPVPQTCDYR